MTTPFTPVPDTRATGEGSPAADMDATADELAALGGSFSVLDANYAGGADPTGTNDSTAAINAALAAATAGQKVTMPPGVFKTTGDLLPPPGVVIEGAGGLDALVAGDLATVIKPAASYSGTAIINIKDVGHAVTQGPILRGFSIDGSDLVATVDGIRATGPVNGGVLEDLVIASPTGVGLNCVIDSSASGQQYPYGWHVSHIKIDGAGEQGIVSPNHSDSTWEDVYVLGNSAHSSGHGWSISGPMPNSRVIGCRMEWAGTGKDGYHLTGAWGTGTGSGGLTFDGCTSDRNDANGMGITATGTVPVVLTGCTFRRDGRNGGTGGGSYAGLNINAATIPIVIDGVTVYPGVDDDGTQTNSPEYGVSVINTSTQVMIDSVTAQGNSKGLNNDGSNNIQFGTNLRWASGSTGSPTVYAGGEISLVCPADQQVNDSTALVDSTYLVTPELQAGSQWLLDGWLMYDASAAGDLKVSWIAPSGNTMAWNGLALGTGAATSTGTPIIGALGASNSTQIAGGIGVGTETAMLIRGNLTIGSTAGTLQLQFAQDTADATNVTLKAGSWLKLRQVA